MNLSDSVSTSSSQQNSNMLYSISEDPPPSYETVIAQTLEYNTLNNYQCRDNQLPGCSSTLISSRPVDPQQHPTGQYGIISQMSNNFEYRNPTVRPVKNFNPIRDVKVISIALKSSEPNMGILKILCKRNLEQRLIIVKEYEKNSNQKLSEEIENKLIGNFKKLMLSLIVPFDILNVKHLHDAIKKNNQNIIADILCTLSNDELKLLKKLYNTTYGNTLENFINEKTSKNFKRLMLEICKCKREELDNRTDGQIRYEAKRDAKMLHSKKSNSNSINVSFLLFFSTKSFRDIKFVCEEYYNIFGKSIERRIKNEFSSGDQKGYLAIAKYARNKHDYFAFQMYKSITGFKRNNDQFIRLTVTRSEIDLQDIKNMVTTLHQKDIFTCIDGEALGHYKLALCILLGHTNLTSISY